MAKWNSHLRIAIGLMALAVSMRIFAPEIQALFDLVRPPAQTSELSRWYSLSELGLQPYSTLLKEGIEQLQQVTAENSGFALMGPCSDRGPLIATDATATLYNTESWEGDVDAGSDTVGYPSVVRNTQGRNADGEFYLFYAIHDVHSGIAMAQSTDIHSDFVKIGEKSMWRIDSRVLRAPRRPHETSHYSSPVVIWNPDEQLWFMYFHYYVNDWHSGMGHQKTALATTNDLAGGRWEPWEDDRGRLIATMPVTSSGWMNSQSTYHSIYRLPNGLWLAFLRGVGGQYDLSTNEWQQDVAKLGFAVSPDGRRWAEVPGNPVIHQEDGRNGRDGVYRPKFIGKLREHLLVCWSESSFYDSDPQLRCGLTEDLQTIKPITLRFSDWQPADGPASIWNSPGRIHIFDGPFVRSYLVPRDCEPR